MISKEKKEFISKRLKEKDIVCITGAGISAESGIPTFRGKQGLWGKYEPRTYATPEGLLSVLRTRPHDLANFIVSFYSGLINADPNAAHRALSSLEKKGFLNTIITQNIDNLHQEAGNRHVIELHGNSYRLVCMGCQHKLILDKKRLKEFTELLKEAHGSYYKILEALSRYFPRCRCGNRYRIDIVFFGETLPEEALAMAYAQLKDCKTLLLIGSSFVVHPASSLPLYAKEKGAVLIEINEEPSALSGYCDIHLLGKASEIMPEIMKLAEGQR